MSDVCPNCEEPVSENDVFCSDCGFTLNKSQVEPATEVSDDLPETEQSNQFAEDASRNEPSLDHSETHEQSLPSPVGNDGHSECSDFRLEWNLGHRSSVAEMVSSLQFRFTPLTEAAFEATDFGLKLYLPGSDGFQDFPLLFRYLRTQRQVVCNYRSNTQNIGLNQSVALHFTYRIGESEYHFEQEILVDIYPNPEHANKMPTSISVKIDSIVQEGKAGDPRLTVFEGLRDQGQSGFELIQQLNGNDNWTVLELFEAHPIEERRQAFPQPTETKSIPDPPPLNYQQLVLHTSQNHRILLLPSTATLGRSKQCDITIRHLPEHGEQWDQLKMRQMNGKISSLHCQIDVSGHIATISDKNSTNSTYIDGLKLSNQSMQLGLNNTTHNLWLADPKDVPYSFQLGLDLVSNRDSALNMYQLDSISTTMPTIGGIILKRSDSIPDTYVIMQSCIAFSDMGLPDFSANFYLVRHLGRFAVVNEQGWTWLYPGACPPSGSAIQSISDA